MAVNNVSGTSNPYEGSAYVAGSNSKNTLTIESFVRLLATQLQNQDVTNPMESSDMMNQMTQMAMVQALSAMTESVSANSAMNSITYAAGMVGKEVTVAVTTENSMGVPIISGSKTGIVETINLTGGEPTFRLQGDTKDYPLSYLLGIGDVTDSVDDSNQSGEDLGGGGEVGGDTGESEGNEDITN